ncbi:MAG: glycosyltransferase, partial [Lachnospiraceae bacterium]|nr:glycosyltransferase [Lachnospiraceae bacterium]
YRNTKIMTWIHSEKMPKRNKKLVTVYQKYNYIFGVSKECIEVFQKTYPEVKLQKMKMLHNPLLVNEIVNKSKERSSINYNKERFLFVSVGRLVKEKSFEIAIESAAILKEKKISFLWVIIGEGCERNRLESQIKTHRLEKEVILHGFDSNPYPFMKEADLYIQTSKVEGFSTTIGEAIVLGTPVISTRVSGVTDQVYPGVNGEIVEGDKYQLADTIEQVINDSELLEKYHQGCLATRQKAIEPLLLFDEYAFNDIMY